MSELDVLHTLAPAPPAAPLDARLGARERLLRHALGGRRRRRLRIIVPSLSLAAASAAAVAVALVGNSAEPASAAAALREAAAVSRAQEPLVLEPGKFVYTASTNAYLSTHSFGGRAFNVLVPHRREIWLDRDGSGWLRQRSGEPRFLSGRDREIWIDYGRPGLDEGTIDVPLARDEYAQQMATVGLPSEPDRLWELLAERAGGHGSGRPQELFTLVADALRENFASPALRSALYEVAARITGVELVGDTVDPRGRPGIAVALDDPSAGTRRVLVFDPETAHLLGERQVALDENPWNYPAGTTVGYAAYSAPAFVERVKERPYDRR